MFNMLHLISFIRGAIFTTIFSFKRMADFEESRRFNSHYTRLSPSRRRRDSRFDDVRMSIMPRTHKRTAKRLSFFHPRSSREHNQT